jgi:protein phosphatase
MSRLLGVEPDPFPTFSRTVRCSKLRVRGAARTDPGLERSNNEDAAAFGDALGVAFEPPASAEVGADACFVGLVCDGMGGEAGGEIASRLAVEAILGDLRAGRLERGDRDVGRGLVASIEAASARIQREAREQPVYARMGTTATLGAVVAGSLVCAQVGDSRAYLFREGRLTQLTRDQTLLELFRRNAEAGADTFDGVGANVILQAVGSSPKLEVVVTWTPLEPGDVVLLCSDGLSGVVPDALIATTLTEAKSPEHACTELVARTLERGAPDNVTCVVFEVFGD